MTTRLSIRSQGSTFEATWETTERTITLTPQIPLIQLEATGLAELLDRPGADNIDLIARKYAQRLAAALSPGSHAINFRTDATLVIVIGKAAETSVVWEALRLESQDEAPVVVVRVHDELAVSVGPTQKSDGYRVPRLNWIGSRQPDDTVPRYAVLGHALSGLRVSTEFRPGRLRTAIESRASAKPDVKERGGVLHLDTHGSMRDSAAAGSGVDPRRLGVALGADFLDAEQLVELVSAWRPVMFVSNACHAGNYVRGQPSLAAQFFAAIDELAVTAVSYGSVDAPVSAIFVASFYNQLASGANVLEAHRVGVLSAAQSVATQDANAKALLQPVLWCRAMDDMQSVVVTPASPQDDGHLRQSIWFRIASLGSVVGRAMEAVEDAVALGAGLPSVRFERGSWDRPSAESFVGALEWAFGPATSAGSAGAVGIAGLSHEEHRCLLSEFFESGSVLIDVLAWLLPTSLFALDELGVTPDIGVAEAVVRAAQVGPIAESQLRVRERNDDQSLGVPVLASACFPVVGIEMGAAIEGLPLPLLVCDIEEVSLLGRFLDLDEAHGTSVRIAKDFSFFARRHSTPQAVATQVLQIGTPNIGALRKGRWTDSAASAVASRTVGAIALRQLGEMEPQLVSILVPLARTLTSEVINLLKAIELGLPGWPTIRSSLESSWQEVVALFENADRVRDFGGPSGDWRELLAAGERDGVRRVAYSLDSDRFGERIDIALALIATHPAGYRHDKAENFHLMAQIQEDQGRLLAAISWLRKEHALPPPSLDRRHHNLVHLYRLLCKVDSAPTEVHAVIGEGLQIARRIGDLGEVKAWLRDGIALGLNASRPDWLQEYNAEARSLTPGPDPFLDLADGLLQLRAGGDPQPLLRRALENGEGPVRSQAALLLSEAEVEDAIEVLWRGILGVAPGVYRTACANELLLRLVALNGLSEMGPHLARLQGEDLRGSIVGYFRAAHEFATGRVTEGEISLVQALILTSGDRFAGVSAALAFSEEETADWYRHTVAALLSAIHLGAEHYQTEAAQDACDSLLTRLPPLFAEDDRRRIAVELVRISELLWDVGVPAALRLAAILRQHACDILGSLPGDDDQRELTVQLSWLAAIYRQSSLVAEARRTYVHALELAEHTVKRGERALIRGRFANLIDDEGDHAEAARQQWCAICDAIGWDITTARTDESLKSALRSSPPDILVINFVNCLEKSGDVASAKEVFSWFLCDVPIKRMPDDMRALARSLIMRLGLVQG